MAEAAIAHAKSIDWIGFIEQGDPTMWARSLRALNVVLHARGLMAQGFNRSETIIHLNKRSRTDGRQGETAIPANVFKATEIDMLLFKAMLSKKRKSEDREL